MSLYEIDDDVKQIEISIFRKRTTTNYINPNSSCHPVENKLAAVGYFHCRLNTYPLGKTDKEKEFVIINTILHNNHNNANISSTTGYKRGK